MKTDLKYRKAIKTKRGKHHGGTYAHSIVALDLLLWMEPRLKIYIFQKALGDNPQDVIMELFKISQEMEEFEEKKVFLYLINQSGTTNYKIGISTDIIERLKTLQTSSVHNLECLAYKMYENASEIEKKIHMELLSKRIMGEWFNLSDNDITSLKDRYFK